MERQRINRKTVNSSTHTRTHTHAHQKPGVSLIKLHFFIVLLLQDFDLLVALQNLLAVSVCPLIFLFSILFGGTPV